MTNGNSTAVVPPGRGRVLHSTLEAVVLMICDMVMLQGAFLATYWFRFYSGIWLVPLGIPPLDLYLTAGLVVLVVFFGIFYTSGMYTARGARTLEDDLVGLFKGVVLGSLLVLALAFFLRELTFSRSFFGLFFLSTFGFLTLGRLLARLILQVIFKRGLARTRTLLVGISPMRGRILRLMRDLPGLAMEPVGWASIAGDPEPRSTVTEVPEENRSLLEAGRPRLKAMPDLDVPCLGEVESIRELVVTHQVDLVLLVVFFDQLPLVKRVASDLANLNVDLHFVPDLLALHTSKMRLKEIGGLPFISVREVALSGADRVVKRSFDVVASGLALAILSVPLAVVALLIKVFSPGPVFYPQERVGRDGREFTMLKFRTMVANAEAKSGPVWTREQDPRVTRMGGVFRRFSVDELPQLFNVLRGDMSLVGPRPERKVFVQEFSQKMPRYFERHRVQSGLTGWAQVHGLRGNTSIEERTLYDLHYVENWSLALDIKILLMTVRHVMQGENAY